MIEHLKLIVKHFYVKKKMKKILEKSKTNQMWNLKLLNSLLIILFEHNRIKYAIKIVIREITTLVI